MRVSLPTGFRDRLRLWAPDGRIGAVLALWLLGAIAILVTVASPSTVKEEIANQLAAGERPSWKLDTVVGIYWAAFANVAIALGTLTTMRWWTQRPSLAQPGPAAGARSRMPLRVFCFALLAIAVLAGALRWNLAHGSLWWDELWNTKMATVGEFRTSSKHPDEERFYPTSFARCAWYYQKPTNHPPVALASKVCHKVWVRLAQPDAGTFNEFVIRLPVFVSALGSVLLIGFLARHWAADGAGLLAACVLAVHPWFIRYGIDARAYGPAAFFHSCCPVGARRCHRERSLAVLVGIRAGTVLPDVDASTLHLVLWSHDTRRFSAFIPKGKACTDEVRSRTTDSGQYARSRSFPPGVLTESDSVLEMGRRRKY